jgi:ATP-dependent Lhr-like helicase
MPAANLGARGAARAAARPAAGHGTDQCRAIALAELLHAAARDVDAALLALETEGFVLRGQFTPDVDELEWCERRLLARIHRYTIRSLRAEIEPVASADFMRFLLDWQG